MVESFSPAAVALIAAGCSFTGGNAPISNGPTTTTVYTVKPGDTLYAVARRYSLDPVAVARENGLSDPSKLRVGQHLKLSISSGMHQDIERIQAHQQEKTSASSSSAAAAPGDRTEDGNSNVFSILKRGIFLLICVYLAGQGQNRPAVQYA